MIDYANAKTAVQWRDLIGMSPRDGLIECLHPLPWLLGSWIAAANGLWVLAVPASFMFFLTALRLNHEAIHGNLGFAARGHRLVLHGLSLVMLGSNNAVAFNHLRHHKHLGSAADLEGGCGRMSIGQVVLNGPVFPVAMHHAAWRDGPAALRRRMRIDGVLNLVLITIAIASGAGWLAYHLAAMLVAQCLTAFFAVWITHHDLDPAEIARTQRARLVNVMTYNMFLHLEHHLFPAVPVKRLGIVSRRLAAVAPTVRLVLPEPRFPTNAANEPAPATGITPSNTTAEPTHFFAAVFHSLLKLKKRRRRR